MGIGIFVKHSTASESREMQVLMDFKFFIIFYAVRILKETYFIENKN